MAGSGRHDAFAFTACRIARDATGAIIRASWKRNLLRADHGLHRFDCA
jgi:hypothetical protein